MQLNGNTEIKAIPEGKIQFNLIQFRGLIILFSTFFALFQRFFFNYQLKMLI